jgi:predicted dehydrogenase
VTPVRVVLAGLGVIGRQHLRLIEASVDFELVGVADPGPSAVTDLPDGVPGCDDFRAMIEETSPSAVIIAAPNQAHAEIALHCLERGIPVLIEKPIAATLDDAAAIVDAVASTGVPARSLATTGVTVRTS